MLRMYLLRILFVFGCWEFFHQNFDFGSANVWSIKQREEFGNLKCTGLNFERERKKTYEICYGSTLICIPCLLRYYCAKLPTLWAFKCSRYVKSHPWTCCFEIASVVFHWHIFYLIVIKLLARSSTLLRCECWWLLFNSTVKVKR